VPLEETGVEFDEGKIDRIVSDIRDEAHLMLVAQLEVNTNRKLVTYEKKSAEQRYHNGERCWDWDGDV
jgi:hypothetical protein